MLRFEKNTTILCVFNDRSLTSTLLFVFQDNSVTDVISTRSLVIK